MDISSLGEDRFLRKNPKQNDGTKDSVYTASNPAPKRGDDSNNKIGKPKGSEEDGGAPNLLTGTVITSCFIQTSALPSRIEMQGNDLTFFDDTFEQSGRVIGDTSRLIFTHGSGKSGEIIQQGFIFEKRASVFSTYDNVLSLYAVPAKTGSHNFLFLGRNAGANDGERNVNTFILSINHDTTTVPDPINDVQANEDGLFWIEYSEDGVSAARAIPFFAGNSKLLSSALDGFSCFIQAGQGGIVGLSYRGDDAAGTPNVLLYLLDSTRIMLGASILPDADGAYDIGAPLAKIGTIYGSVVACPLPTVDNALEILDRIPAPSLVGERGHYGFDRKYFDDLTFPEEVLFTDSKGRTEIEHNNLLGFMLKAIIELKAEVDFLKNRS